MYDVIIIGAGGHAKVLADIVLKNGYGLLGFLDDDPTVDSVMGYPVLGRVDACRSFADRAVFAIGIGSAAVRQQIFETYPDLDYITLIHPAAVVGADVQIDTGCVVMAGAVLSPSVKIGRFCIINSGAVVEHDCDIGEFSHAAPHSTLCGTVRVGARVWLGAGCVVKNNLTICDEAMIGAGAVVVKNIVQKGTYVGVPAGLHESGVLE